MPPKKAAAGKGKKKKVKKKKEGLWTVQLNCWCWIDPLYDNPKGAGVGDELTVAELYRRTSQEVDSLKERLGMLSACESGSLPTWLHHAHPAERQAYARHARASEEVMRERMVEAKTVASEDKLMMKEVSTG